MFITIPVQASFSVNKQLIEVEVNSGKKHTGTIIVENHGKSEKNIVIRPVDYFMDAKGNVKTSPVGGNKYSLYPYMNLSTNNLVIEPGKNIKVRYTIDIPEEVKGSRWLALYFEEEEINKNKENDNKNTEGANITVNYKIRYRTLILATVKNTERAAGKVVNLERKKDDVLSFKLDFKNTGNVYYKASGRMDIRNSKGETVIKIPIEEFFVFPDQERTVTVKKEARKKLESGEYVALAIIDYGGDKLVAGQMSFKVDNN